ncbi:MAG: hypothetical protein H7A08_07845 [Oceanospirillaceae bacterium]|nr:hypothetical protein [Oceanospirillaceae bacterium]
MYDGTETEADIDVSGSAIYGGYVFPSNNRFQISLTSISASFDEGSDADFLVSISTGNLPLTMKM